ncbi:metallophosphoesterase [Lyngbya aestuarii]|uniref:metallophosphoesterase n=1 Tax=Lyngbya aestuarii TaxID=118322 RepID=UPI00403DA2FE
MTHRCIVIGDVHGHYDSLLRLLDAVAPSAEDKVYFLGDLIDRGPQSAKVVSFVKQSPYFCLLGNHEQMLLELYDDDEVYEPALQAWLHGGGRTTLQSYGKGGVLKEHIEWMRTLPTYIDLGDIWLVHAGVHPRMPIEKQTPEQFCWIRDEFHGMREPYFPDKLIITGHTITFTLPGIPPGKIAQGQGWLDIETGAYHPKSGWMTALDVTNGLVYQVNVFRNQVRQLPLKEAIAPINLSVLGQRRSMLHL